jgi:hypothetical protein
MTTGAAFPPSSPNFGQAQQIASLQVGQGLVTVKVTIGKGN